MPTGQFLDDLVARYGRYGAHLFVCFDDPQIPATTHGLEGFFGDAKRLLRHTVGSGSTTQTTASNLGGEILLAYGTCRDPANFARVQTLDVDATAFRNARTQIARDEAPAIKRRSMVRHLDRHLAELRRWWSAPPEAKA